MSDCLFCKILSKEIPSESLYEDENVYAFRDIAPMAKEHVLFIHKEHSKNVNEMDSEQIASVFNAIKTFTQDKGLEEDGFRVVTNVNKDGGQTVFHTHFHLIYGERLGRFGK